MYVCDGMEGAAVEACAGMRQVVREGQDVQHLKKGVENCRLGWGLRLGRGTMFWRVLRNEVVKWWNLLW